LRGGDYSPSARNVTLAHQTAKDVLRRYSDSEFAQEETTAMFPTPKFLLTVLLVCLRPFHESIKCKASHELPAPNETAW
jgi:hypothetical protein